MVDEWQESAWRHMARRADARAFGVLVEAIGRWATTNDPGPLELVVEQLRDTWQDEWQQATIDLPEDVVDRAFALIADDDDDELTARLALARRTLFEPLPGAPTLRVRRRAWHYFARAVEQLQAYDAMLDERSPTAPLVADAMRVFRAKARRYLFVALASSVATTEPLQSAAGVDPVEPAADPATSGERSAEQASPRSPLELIHEGIEACCHPFDSNLGIGPWYDLLDSESTRRLIPPRRLLDGAAPIQVEVLETMGDTVLAEAPSYGEAGPVCWAGGRELASFIRELDFDALELDGTVEEIAEQELEEADLPVTDEAVEEIIERWRREIRAAFEQFVEAAQRIAARGEVLVCWDECSG